MIILWSWPVRCVIWPQFLKSDPEFYEVSFFFQVGVYDVDPAKIKLKSRLKPGRMLLVDTQEGRVIQDVELKRHIAEARPHQQWLKEHVSNFT